MNLVDRLAGHRTVGGSPREELQWLVDHGTLRAFERGAVTTEPGGLFPELYMLFVGHMVIYDLRGGAQRIVTEWRGGEVTGVLPYSRMTSSPGRVVVQEFTEGLAVHRDHFPELIHKCPTVTATLVHVMLDRARHFRTDELRDEKMRSLGRLAAGLAHELNNPASAVARSAKTLAAGLATLDEAARALGACTLTPPQWALVQQLREGCLAPHHAASPLARVEQEDAISEWLDSSGQNGIDAGPLVDAGIGATELQALASLLPSKALPVALAYLAAICDLRRLAAEIETASGRIHHLVSAVKGFTYMDQAPVAAPVDVARGLEDTITVLRAKARAHKVNLRLDAPRGLPRVEGFGGELNQVWANLIDNAIDAVPEGGHVTVKATAGEQSLSIAVIDDGPGIPDDVRARIFEPFFTTKGVGEGTGLGLEMARRLVEHHRGSIDVSTGPSGSTFEVRLPLAAPRPSGA